MQNYKLANIVLANDRRAMRAPGIYCRSSSEPYLFNREEGCYELYSAGEFDFTTYFNACSQKKWREYTVVNNFHLHLELRGGAAKVFLTCADPFSLDTELIEGASFDVPQSDGWQVLDIEYPEVPDVLIGFMIITEDSVFIKDSYYYSRVQEDDIRPVELALGMTTFKKEDFVIPNIELLKTDILQSDEPIAQHFTAHVVDNGRSLDTAALETDKVHIYPNKNVGGAGGFTRAMIESMRSTPKATHILLMDDDVAVSPESIKRTYTLLTLVNDEYKDAFISGAMLNYDIPDAQWEDLGYVNSQGFFNPVKEVLRVSLLRDLVLNESYELHQNNMYAAWWYCCMPISTVERVGLPLPLFVRGDDVEYGCRCNPKYMSMNGIGIWHESFHTRYNAAVERYQTTRNTLIAQAISGAMQDVDFTAQYSNGVQIELKKFNYKNAELAIDGFEDFLKGPEFIMQKDIAEQKFMEKGRAAEKLESLEEIEKRIGSFEVDRGAIYQEGARSLKDRIVDYITFNGQRTPYSYNETDDLVIIPSEGWLYPASRIRGANRVLAVDVYNKKGIIRTKDKKRFKEVWTRYKKSMSEYKRNKEQLRASYAAVRDKVTSQEFWKDYLEID